MLTFVYFWYKVLKSHQKFLSSGNLNGSRIVQSRLQIWNKYYLWSGPKYNSNSPQWVWASNSQNWNTGTWKCDHGWNVKFDWSRPFLVREKVSLVQLVSKKPLRIFLSFCIKSKHSNSKHYKNIKSKSESRNLSCMPNWFDFGSDFYKFSTHQC